MVGIHDEALVREQAHPHAGHHSAGWDVCVRLEGDWMPEHAALVWAVLMRDVVLEHVLKHQNHGDAVRMQYASINVATTPEMASAALAEMMARGSVACTPS